MNEERGSSISGLDSLVFFSCRIIIHFTIILISYVTNSVAAVSAEFLSLLPLNDFLLDLTSMPECYLRDEIRLTVALRLCVLN